MSDQLISIDRVAIKAALATLSEHLSFECAEVDEHGRYVFDFGAMSEMVDALDEIEEAIDDDDAEDGE